MTNTITKIVTRDYGQRYPSETFFMKVIAENKVILHGIQCNEHGNVDDKPTERILWKSAIRQRKEIER